MRLILSHMVILASIGVNLPASAREGAPSASVSSLPVKGFRAAVVVAPDLPGRRPVVVALHGNFDRPEWNCSALPALVRGRAWILCIRGIPRKDTPRSWDRWTYSSDRRVKRELDAAVKALGKRYPKRVDEGALLLAGFSLGATYAGRFGVADPTRFPRLYLVEGAYKVFKPAAIRRFARRGGKAIVFGCGRKGCGRWARRTCKRLERAGVSCAEVTALGLGHSYTEPLPTLARPRFERMIGSDPRWGQAGRGAARQK